MVRMVLWLCAFVFTAVPSLLAQWERVILPKPYRYGYFLDVFFLPSDPRYGWACGFNGYVVRTTDGGKTWKGTQLPNAANHMESIHFVSPLVGWCSGTNPDRIFRTTDGGVTWTNVTPSGGGEIWGCYFVNDSVGVAVGGGCGTPQYFYRTTDGGDTWSVVQYNEPGSGLSDVILYSENGLGYAVSSGRIWRTTDGGRNWAIVNITGPKHWQEELAKNGPSFLLPSAGNTCNGDGPGGEMSFSPNGGGTWLAYSTGRSMFGSFLLTPTVGWGVGDSGMAIRTTNGGYSWELLNCGVEGINLDDIWFVNDTTAFIAGAGGLYRMVWPPVKPKPDTLRFDTICVGQQQRKKIWIKNYWRKSYPAYSQLIGSSAFTTDFPAVLSVEPCDSMPATIVFTPQQAGKHTAVFHFTTPTVPRTFMILIEGYALPPVNYVVSPDTVVIDPAYCGEDNVGSSTVVPVDTTQLTIESVERVGGSAQIALHSPVPLAVTAPGTPLSFRIDPPDTGWYEARFRIFVNECSPDTEVVVRAYGVSPIILAPQRVQRIVACRQVDTLHIPVANGGNDTLHIAAVRFSGPDTAIIQSVFWHSQSVGTVAIPPNVADTLAIVVRVEQEKSFQFAVALINDDRTRVRGVANPKNISVEIATFQPTIELATSIVDFGMVCVGESKDTMLRIENLSSREVSLNFVWNDAHFELRQPSRLPVKVRAGGSLTTRWRFAPTAPGMLVDTVEVVVQPCNFRYAVIIRGNAVSSEVAAIPDQVQQSVVPGDTVTVAVVLRSVGTTTAVVTTITLTPTRDDWTVEHPPLPLVLLPGEEVMVQLRMFPQTDTTYTGQLCVGGNAVCAWQTCVPIKAAAEQGLLSVVPGAVAFPTFACTAHSVEDTVWVWNAGSKPLTVYGAQLASSQLQWQFSTPLPLNLLPKDTAFFTVRWQPTGPGSYEDTLWIFSSVDTVGVPIHFAWYRPEIQILADPAADEDTLFRCDPPQQWQWTVRNSGNRDDTLEIVLPESLSGVTRDPQVIPLPVNAVDSFTIRVDPAQFAEGVYAIPVVLQWRFCGIEDTLYLPLAVRDPRGVLQPTAVELGPVFARKAVAVDTVYLLNPSQWFPIEVMNITALPGSAELEVRSDPLPLTLAPQSALPIEVRYVPIQPDTLTLQLLATIGPRCGNQPQAEIRAIAVEKVYPMEFRIPFYEAAPGDTVDIAVLLRADLREAVLQQLSFTVKFVPTILLPFAVSLGTNGATLPFDYQLSRGLVGIGLDSATLANAVVPYWQGDIDTLVRIRGVVQLTDEPASPLAVRNVQLQSPEHFQITQVDGELKLRQICLLDLRNVVFAPTFRVLRVSDPMEPPQLLVQTTGALDLQLSVIDVKGTHCYEYTFSVGAGEHWIPLPEALASGVYLWKLLSPYQVRQGWIWIVK